MTATTQAKSMFRPTTWDDQVEEAWRFQSAGYKDERDYLATKEGVDRWPHNGYVKKLQRKDGCFIYFNKTRECPDKDVGKCKIYIYE